MAIDPYAFCLCGSGKKFKWCCQPIFGEIEKIFELDQAGQTDTALTMLEALTKKHPENPEVWGRLATMYFQHDRPEDAEKALEEAFKANPNYAYGFYLRGRFRLFEGEVGGALLLFRKAVDVYHPEAHGILHDLYVQIGQGELQLNRPVAARAALELALKNNPQDNELRQAFDTVFAEGTNQYPKSAKRAYHFMPPAGISPEKQETWRKGLERAQARLSEVVKAFEALVQQDEKDSAAWFNLGLCHAWLGQNAPAVRALESYLQLETDETKAAQAWVLAEILRCGHGMTDQADFIDHTYVIPVKNPQGFFELLGKLESQGSLTGLRVDEERGMLTGAFLEEAPVALTPELQARQLRRVSAMFMMTGNMFQLWHTDLELLNKVVSELKQKVGQHLGEPYAVQNPAKFIDVVSDVLAVPKAGTPALESIELMREHSQKFYEDKWIHVPRKSLGGVPPIDAAGHPQLRKKLLGIIDFIEECALQGKHPYDFNRLRHKLHLPTKGEFEAGAAAADISSMSTADLAGLALDSLQDAQLEEAFQAAQKLDAREVAGRFAEALVTRPHRAERADRFVWFNHLIQRSQGSNDFDAAMNWVNDGERDDCEHNEGRRRNDYELRRAQVHAKRGEFDQAQDVFDRLIQRDSGQLKVIVTAAETMLAAKQPARALRFAETGLAESRKQNQRDSEGHFLELVDAAKRQGA